MTIYDAIVIGGGPAGSTVSILLAQAGYRILLLEKSTFPRHKLCGEFITPESLRTIERLGVRERMLQAGAKLISRWTLFAQDGRGVEVPIDWLSGSHSHGIAITRARMDSILLERAREAGVEARESFLVSPRFERQEGLGIIAGKTDGETVERFSARIVIDASGRHGPFSPQDERPSSRFEGSRLFGCKVYLRGIKDLNGTGELYFFRDGYGGITEVEDERTNLCFMTTEATLLTAKGDREKLLDLTMRDNPAARQRLKGATIDSDWVGTGPINYGWSRSRPGLIAIGDAGAFIDPFTGSGIMLALSSGELAASVIGRAWAEGIRDPDEIAIRYRQSHRASFGWRFRACALLRRLAFKPLTRNLLVSLMVRHRSLARLVAISTRLEGDTATD